MKRLTISQETCTETLALLITMAWADGRLDETEQNAVRAAADVLGLSADLRERLDTLLAQPLPVDQLLFDTVSRHDRAFAFVAAAWLSGVDDDVDPKETALLAKVGTLLEFSLPRRRELIAIARELSPPRKGKHRWAQEIVTLFNSIAPRLEGADATFD